MAPSAPQLDRVDLSTNSRNTLAALIKLLTPHIPYTIHILGAILNSGPRASTLQHIDPSKVEIWSTTTLDHDAISTTGPPELFSIVVFSHLNHQFCVFCSSESRTSSDPPTETEKTHIKYVFEYLRDTVARAARPTYDSDLTPRGSTTQTHPPMIVIGAVHPKWTDVLEPMSIYQSLNVRYAFSREAFTWNDTAMEGWERCLEENGVEVSEIRASDLPLVHGASTIPRLDAYLLSRAPYSACLRLREDTTIVGERDELSELGRPVACVLMHADGSLGALRVDAERQRRGLGRLVLRALVEKLDFSQGRLRGDDEVSDDHQDLGGGALGWFWMDTGPQNEAANRFLTSVVGEARSRPCYWTYIQID